MAHRRCCGKRSQTRESGIFFDAVLSVEEVGVYKPHPKVYQLAVDRLGVKREAISFQSSITLQDAMPPRRFGMRGLV